MKTVSSAIAILSVAFALVALPARAALAQGAGTVRGTVTDSSSNQPIAGAQVQLVGTEVQPVPGLVGPQPPRGRSEVGAQPRHVGVQGLSTRLRRLPRPQGIDQLVDGDHPTLGERQQRKYRTPFRSADVNRNAADQEPERAEYRDLDRWPGVLSRHTAHLW